MAFKYSITLSSFRNIETLERTLERLVQQGYDAIEMFGEPENVDLKSLIDTFHSFDIPLTGITGMWGPISPNGWKRRFISLEPSIVTSSQQYVQQCIEMCYSLGGDKVNICLFADDRLVTPDRNHNMISEDQKAPIVQRTIPLLAELSGFAKQRGIQLLLEPLNRYSTPYCTTADDAVSIAKQINQDNFGILLDTFHMNIEEDSFEHAILKSERLLQHTHFADNNRKMPGYGHIDFKSIVNSLRKIGYNHYISFEPNLTRKDYKSATKNGLEFIKSI